MAMFGETRDREYEVLVAENKFINRIQTKIERAMEEYGMKQSDLARTLGVSEARISQILGGNGKNLQARTIAKIAFALGLDADVEFFKGNAKGSLASSVMNRQTSSESRRIRCEDFLHVQSIYNDNFWVEQQDGTLDDLVAA